MENKRFEGKVVLVTGGTSGIGRATAVAFAREGARVIIAGRRENLGSEVVGQIEGGGGEAVYVKTDIKKPEEIENLFNAVLDKYGRLDCAFNNAGVSSPKAPITPKYTLEDWDNIMDTNLRGTWLCMKYEIEQMLKQGGGTIVNTASVLGFVGHLGLSLYCASKHAVIGLTRSAALEYIHKNIRINAVCPGPIRTEMLMSPQKYLPNLEELIIAETPMRRIGEPGEIAGAVLWLCSEESSFMVGKELVIAGGQSVL